MRVGQEAGKPSWRAEGVAAPPPSLAAPCVASGPWERRGAGEGARSKPTPP